MDLPGDVTADLDHFVERVRARLLVVAVHLGGSAATGDYRPATSDLDLVAFLDREVPAREVRSLHRERPVARASGGRLGCVYVPLGQRHEVGVPHLTWSHDRLFRRPVSGVTRADLLAGGVTLLGPRPADLIDPMSDGDVRAAVRAELRGYWSRAVARRTPWWSDAHVDLALLTLARADVALTDSRLITKTEALEHLPRLGVPDALVDGIRRRRDGRAVRLSPIARAARARLVRRLTQRAVATMGQDASRA